MVKPKIYELINVTSSVNLETKLICKATGRPAPEVTFKKFGSKNYFTIGTNRDNPRLLIYHSLHYM